MNGAKKEIRNKAIKAAAQAAVAFLSVFLLWEIAYVAVGNEWLLPNMAVCLQKAAEFLGNGAFWIAFCRTFVRVTIAFVCSFLSAVVCAFAAYLLPWFRVAISPIVAILRVTPVLAALLILLVWTGAGVAPILVAFLSLFPLLYTETYTALCNTDKTIETLNLVYKVPKKRQIFQFYLPSVLPYAVREGCSGFAFALKLVVSAEVLANTYQSIGGMLQETKWYSEIPALFALVLLVCITGLLIETAGMLVSARIERRLR